MSAPSTIAHYRIIEKLGEGGIGAVYRAIDAKLNREVTIKVLPEALANDPDYSRKHSASHGRSPKKRWRPRGDRRDARVDL